MRLVTLLSIMLMILACFSACGTEDTEEAGEVVAELVEEAAGNLELLADNEASSTDEDAEEPYTGEYVYVTEHGSKYHAPDCQHVAGHDNLRRLTREQALAEGYEPCKVCCPGYE